MKELLWICGCFMNGSLGSSQMQPWAYSLLSLNCEEQVNFMNKQKGIPFLLIHWLMDLTLRDLPMFV